MTTEALKGRSLKDLAQLAKRRGIAGWHSMNKDQLVRALGRAAVKSSGGTKTSAGSKPSASPKLGAKARPAARSASKLAKGRLMKPHTPSPRPSHGHASAGSRSAGASSASSRNADSHKSTRALTQKLSKAPLSKAPSSKVVATSRPSPPKVVKKIEAARERRDQMKNLASRLPTGRPQPPAKDRLIVMVRDAYWLHAYWELTDGGVRRAEAALGQDWHTARPVLRLVEVFGNGTTSSTERVVRDIEVHGGVNNWYLDVHQPPRSFRVDIGYLTANARFFLLARSNMVTTPRPGASDELDENWADVMQNVERIYALSGGYESHSGNSELREIFEERLRRPMGTPTLARVGLNGVTGRRRGFKFEVDAELIVFGATEPEARVTLSGEPVKVRPDGTFTVRYSLPNCRQVIPAVAARRDGGEQRTVILAVERNTKVLDPVVRESSE